MHGFSQPQDFKAQSTFCVIQRKSNISQDKIVITTYFPVDEASKRVFAKIAHLYRGFHLVE